MGRPAHLCGRQLKGWRAPLWSEPLKQKAKVFENRHLLHEGLRGQGSRQGESKTQHHASPTGTKLSIHPKSNAWLTSAGALQRTWIANPQLARNVDQTEHHAYPTNDQCEHGPLEAGKLGGHHQPICPNSGRWPHWQTQRQKHREEGGVRLGPSQTHMPKTCAKKTLYQLQHCLRWVLPK